MNIPFFKQDNDYSCGPTALQMVFAFYGKILSEKYLTKKLKTKKDKGTEHSFLIKIANKEGFYVYTNNNSNLEEISYITKENIPVIVHIMEPSGYEGHYSVIVNITKKNVILNDPWNGKNFRMSIENFVKNWHNKNSKYKQWIMAISKEQFSLGKQSYPKP